MCPLCLVLVIVAELCPFCVSACGASTSVPRGAAGPTAVCLPSVGMLTTLAPSPGVHLTPVCLRTSPGETCSSPLEADTHALGTREAGMQHRDVRRAGKAWKRKGDGRRVTTAVSRALLPVLTQRARRWNPVPWGGGAGTHSSTVGIGLSRSPRMRSGRGHRNSQLEKNKTRAERFPLWSPRGITHRQQDLWRHHQDFSRGTKPGKSGSRRKSHEEA